MAPFSADLGAPWASGAGGRIAATRTPRALRAGAGEPRSRVRASTSAAPPRPPAPTRERMRSGALAPLGHRRRRSQRRQPPAIPKRYPAQPRPEEGVQVQREKTVARDRSQSLPPLCSRPTHAPRRPAWGVSRGLPLLADSAHPAHPAHPPTHRRSGLSSYHLNLPAVPGQPD